jgi:hypothetical protein
MAQIVALPETGGDPQDDEEGHRQPDERKVGNGRQSRHELSDLPPPGYQLFLTRPLVQQTVLLPISQHQHNTTAMNSKENNQVTNSEK